MEMLRQGNHLAALFEHDEIYIISAIDCSDLDKPAPGMSFVSSGLTSTTGNPTPFEMKPFIALLTQCIRHYAQLQRTSPDVVLDQLSKDINTHKLTIQVDHEPETF